VTALLRLALFFRVFIWAWLQQPCDNSAFFLCAHILVCNSHKLLNFFFLNLAFTLHTSDGKLNTNAVISAQSTVELCLLLLPVACRFFSLSAMMMR
jgi:hypothetical protein